ncbi:MAG TPA: outer membrane beta-barrel protein [Bacteroidia bacterium]|nr:outer membrane beta-barrel protein [Bacteroidia bacterium]
MKTTKKLVAIAVLCVAGFSASAQKMVGGNINVGIPSGTFSSGVNTGFGANVDFRMFMMENIAVGGQIGFESWGAKASGLGGVKISAIPVLLSGDYFLGTEGLMPYGGVQLGYSSNKVTVATPIGDIETSEGGLAYGFRAGVLYPLNDMLRLNASAGYKSYAVTGGSIAQISINLGVMYNLGE